jgi:hypothetical protein
MLMNSKGCIQRLVIPLLLVLICATALGISAQTASTTKARAQMASAATGLHVVGNRIEDGSGRVITPHGVDRMGSEYSCPSGNTFDGPVDQASVNAMLSWGINIVRLPLNEDCWLGINGYPGGGLSANQYHQALINYVNLLNQNGMIVILDLHWNNSGTNKATGQEPMPDLDHAPAFWTSVANTFKGNSSVIFDLYNEPYTTSWSCWKNGSTSAWASPCSDVGFAVAGMQTLINAVRSTGATNILMLGGLAYSNNLSGWLANEPSDPDHNLVASTHIYNFNACSNTSCWNSQIAPVAASVPVLAGELGENDCADNFINGLMSWLDQHGIGYLAWTWTPYNCSSTPALITSYTGTPTTYGQGYKNHLLSLGGGNPPPPTPTPTPGTYYKIVNRNSGLVLDISGASTANGGQAIQWPYTGGANQQWREVPVNGGYKLVNRNSGLVLDDPGWSKSNGTQLDQWADTNGANQWWNLVPAGNGYYYLVNQNSGLYADVSGASTTQGAAVIQWPSNGGANQQWQLIPVS